MSRIVGRIENPSYGSSRAHIVDPHRIVEERNGEPAAVGVEVQVAGVVRQRDGVERLGVVRSPEPEGAAAAAARRIEEAGRMPIDAPGGALEVGLRPQELTALTGLPVEKRYRRFADAGEGVGDIGDAGAGEQ